VCYRATDHFTPPLLAGIFELWGSIWVIEAERQKIPPHLVFY
jgi:hypothetical protein